MQFEVMKRWIIFLVVPFLVSSCSYLNTGNVEVQSPFKAVPVDASMIIVVKDLKNVSKELSENNLLWSGLQNLNAHKKLTSQISFVDSLRVASPVFESVLNKEFLISAHIQGKNKLVYNYYLMLPKGIKPDKVIQELSTIFGASKINERIYSDVKFYELNHEKRTFHLYIHKGLLAFSPSKIQLEKSLRNLNSDSSIELQEGFEQVKNTAGSNVPLNIYMNFKNIGSFFNIVIPGAKNSKNVSDFAQWTEIDLNVKKDHLLFNGFSYNTDSLSNYLSCFKNQNTCSFKFQEFIPYSINWFFAFGITDFGAYLDDYKSYLKASKEIEGYNSYVSSLRKNNDVDIEEVFETILSEEIVLLNADFPGLSDAENNYAVLKTNSASQTYEEIKKLINAKNNKPINSSENKISIDSETSFRMFDFPLPDILSQLFGDFFSAYSFNKVCIIDNYLVFAQTENAVRKFIRQHITRKTLHSSVNYQMFSEYASSNSNLFYYMDLFRMQEEFPSFFNKHTKKDLENNRRNLENLHAFSMQISGGGNLAYTSFILKYSDNLRDAPQTIWESRLDTTVSMKPFLMKNHYTGEKEILIQDNKNNLYLINDLGRILWKVKLKEAIMSDVYQVDYYKNNKLQFLFNTKNKLYLIDRNGNNVENYPVQLRSEATNGLALFDYEKNRNYRIFIAGKDMKVYAYEKSGKLVQGWKKPVTENYVYQPVQHFRIGKRDYLVLGDKLKTYILNRKGENRVKVLENISKSRNNGYYLDMNTGNAKGKRLVTTDSKGNVCYIYFNGKVEKNKINEFSDGHYFALEDLNGDRKKEFVFLDKNSLMVFNSSRRKLFDYNFDNNIDTRPYLYEFSKSDIKIGIVFAKENKIFLFNNTGKLYKGFPLDGNTPFSIGKFRKSGGRFNLVVGNYDNSLYNYKVQ